jgi:hypothetical protein
MRPTRTVLPALLVAALAGCGGGGSNPAATTDAKGGKVDKGSPAADTKAVDAGKKFAADFLAAVRDKKATPDQLTPEFKAVFADNPVAELTFLAGEVGADDVTAAGGADGAVFAMGKNKAGTRTLLRAVKVGADWKADWLSVGPKGVGSAVLTGDNAPAQFAAQAFVDAVAAKKYAHAAALSSPAAKTKYGESVISKTFDLGTFGDTLAKLLPGPEAYTVSNTSAGTVTVDVTAGGKKTATIKTVKGSRPGEWLVDSVEVK